MKANSRSTAPRDDAGKIASGTRLGDRLAAPPSWAGIAAIVVGLLAVLAATNRWMGFHAALVYVHADDENAYLKMAGAAPGLPSERIADQHAQRWPVHWLAGSVADVSGIAVETVYAIAAALVVVALLTTAAAVMRRIGASTATVLLGLGVIALNPYSIRYYGLAPAYLADLLLDLALALLLLGMVARRLPLVLLALVLGTGARQTTLPVVPVVAVWLAVAPDWRGARGRIPVAAVLAAVLLPLAAYLVVHGVAADFSRSGIPLTRLTILEVTLDLPGTAGDLVNHFAHVVNALLAVAALLLATLLSARLRELPPLFWGSLAVGGAVVLQAAVLSPDPVFNDFSSSNESRLAAMGLVPLGVALVAARGAVEARGARPLASTPATVAVLLLLLALGSLHHNFTSISTGSKEVTIAIELLAAAGLLLALRRSDRRGRDDPSEREGYLLPAV